MNCPSCAAAFAPEEYEGVTVDVCSSCRGVWLDQGELQKILKRKDRVFKPQEVDAVNRLCGAGGTPKPAESRDLPCPKCATAPMQTFNYNYSSGVLVDRCKKGCGLWLDADELEKIQIHSELWSDKLEANRERFTLLAGQVDQDARHQIDQLEKAPDGGRYRFVSSVIRGLIKIGE